MNFSEEDDSNFMEFGIWKCFKVKVEIYCLVDNFGIFVDTVKYMLEYF